MRAVRVTQIGSWPGTDHAMALRISFEETPDLPVLPELPARGAAAGMIGRATALLSGLEVDLQPAGWRLIHGTARDQRRARQLLRDDLERLEERAQGHHGPIKIAVTGPWTLAANLELPMGEKVLGDAGARRDVAESLAEGVVELRADLARRLPEVAVVVQLDEPMLGPVRLGEVRTASGLHRYGPIDEADLVQPLKGFLASGATWLHSCGPDVPVATLAHVDDLGLSLDESLVTRAGWDALGPLLEQGRTVALGVATSRLRSTGGAVGGSTGGASGGSTGGAASGSTGGSAVAGPDAIAHHVLRRLDQLGLGPEVMAGLWLTPSCGLAMETEADAVRTLRHLRTAAGIVSEELVGS